MSEDTDPMAESIQRLAKHMENQPLTIIGIAYSAEGITLRIVGIPQKWDGVPVDVELWGPQG